MAQTMDIYVPLHKKSEKLPVIVTIFGTNDLWGKGDKMWAGDSPFLSYLLDGNYACVKINYRLGPMGWFTHPGIQDFATGMDLSLIHI